MVDHRKILITGGSGLLGGEFKKLLPDALYPTRDDLDVSVSEQVEKYFEGKDIATVFHGAAFTSPPKVEKDPARALDSNIIGTANIVKACINCGARLIYVSTDYVFSGNKGNYKEEDPVHPVNKYAWSKLGGECAVRMYENSVIIRTSFGPNDFPYEKAFVDQWTSRESVSAVAKMMMKIVDSDYRGVVHIGGDRKTVHEYAVKLSPHKAIGELSVNEVSFEVPEDTSLNVELYRTLFENK